MAENQALNRLLNILKTSGADAWEVTDVQEKGWEFYLIRHALDQNRVKELESFRIKVYRKFDDCLGSAGAPVPDKIELPAGFLLFGDFPGVCLGGLQHVQQRIERCFFHFAHYYPSLTFAFR